MMTRLTCAALTHWLVFSIGCGTPDSVTGDDTDGSSSSTDPTTGSSETGVPVAMCQTPDPKDDVDFEIEFGSFPKAADIEVLCTVTGGGGGGKFDASYELSCSDDKAVEHAVTIGLVMFYEPVLTVFSDGDQVLLKYHSEDDFGVYRELVALRGLEDSLLLFAARGYEVFLPELSGFWQPLAFAPVATDCEDLGPCVAPQRAALDVTLADVTERIFDRDQAEFGKPGGFRTAVQVGSAHIVETSSECAGDGPEGLETTIVALRHSTP